METRHEKLGKCNRPPFSLKRPCSSGQNISKEIYSKSILCVTARAAFVCSFVFCVPSPSQHKLQSPEHQMSFILGYSFLFLLSFNLTAYKERYLTCINISKPNFPCLLTQHERPKQADDDRPKKAYYTYITTSCFRT